MKKGELKKMKKIYISKGIAQVHPSEAISVSGISEKGQEVNIFLTQESIENLQATFKLAEKWNIHLGHAYWHVKEGQYKKCSSCKK